MHHLGIGRTLIGDRVLALTDPIRGYWRNLRKGPADGRTLNCDRRR